MKGRKAGKVSLCDDRYAAGLNAMKEHGRACLAPKICSSGGERNRYDIVGLDTTSSRVGFDHRLVGTVHLAFDHGRVELYTT
jgi:hypothetical protein